MGREKSLNQQLKDFKVKLEKKLGVVQMILFGSTAEGTAGPDSDVDLIIVSSKFKGKK
ncbi:nucleotidyltransferase domain-containing protein [Candidatus Micrarchaeota archaeon]|nr:nucleotidyltransferase domain-containing protein [Candidatus Micrarchaeota archaeon]